MRWPRGEPVTISRHTQTGTDRYGNPIYTWADVATVDRAAIAPGTSQEPVQVGRTAVITGLVVYLPPGTDVTAVDRLTVRGTTYEVDGQPGDWRNPYTGVAEGIQVSLKDVEG